MLEFRVLVTLNMSNYLIVRYTFVISHMTMELPIPNILAQPLTLPCGAIISNCLSKAAMTEGLATGKGAAHC